MGESGLKVDSVLAMIDHGPFVGRGTKMSRLMETYACVQGGQSWIMSIKGESGIGKTRMASEFLEWATIQGADVLRGRAFEAGGRWPYQPLIEMLEWRRAHGKSAQYGQNILLDPLKEMLDRVLTEMRTYTFNQFSEEGWGKTEYKRLFESFTLLGQALAEQTPVVMFIDDIHWSDFASLALLQYASRRWIESNTPLFILLSLRPEALVMFPTFAVWLAHIERDLHTSSFILNPLTLEDTTDFVLALAADETLHLEGFGRWLYNETGGQAFYMVELLKMLFFEQKLLREHEQKDGEWKINFEPVAGNGDMLELMVLPGVHAVIAMHLKLLTPDARMLVTAGAVLGRSLPFAYLCYVAGLSEEEGCEALSELLMERIFCEEAAHYFFIHDKVREVAYAETTGAQRMELHARALEMLHIEAAPVSFQAYHAQAAGLYEQAFYLYSTAGDIVLRLFAFRDAIAFYESALHLLMEQQVQEGVLPAVPLPTIEHLYLQSGHVYEVLHERERAWATYQSMFLLAKRMNVTTLVHDALCQLALVTRYKTFDMQEQARILFQEETGYVGDAALLAENEWQLTQFNFYRFDAETSLQHGELALQLAREADLPELIARTLSALANAHMLVNAWEVVESLAEEACIFYERQHNTVLEAICLLQVAQAKFSRSQPQESVIAARGAYLAFIQAEYSWGRVYAAYHLVAGLLDIGAYGEALTLAQDALTWARIYNVALLLCLCLTALGRVRRALMDPVSAYSLHREAMSIFPTEVPQPIMEMLTAELCADCALADEWAEAQSYATQALECRSNSTFLYAGLTRWYETEILVRTGYSERATADAEQLGRLSGQSPRYRISYLRMLAVLALWRGEFELAHLYLQKAGELADEIGLPGELWSIEAARGELYYAQGNETGAHTAFEHASKLVYTLAERIEDEQVRAKFLASQQAQRVITHSRSRFYDAQGEGFLQK